MKPLRIVGNSLLPWRGGEGFNIPFLLCVVAGEFRADNRRIFDDGKAQELTEGDIQAMKGHGISGQVS